MPKVSKKSTNKSSQDIGGGGLLTSKRHLPLGQVLLEDVHQNKYAMSKPKTYTKASTEQQRNEDGEEDLLDEKTSRRILQLGALQQREEELELEQQKRQHLRTSQTRSANRGYTNRSSTYQPQNDSNSSDDDDQSMEEEEEEENDEEDALYALRGAHVVRHTEGYVTVDGPGLSDAEEEENDRNELRADTTNRMVTTNQQRRTLADIILAKIRDKEADAADNTPATNDVVIPGQLPPKVVEVYTDIGKILSRYTAGKLPKAFKVIPSLSNWEEILYLTRPDLWTPQAMYAGTRIFASNLNPKMAQRFYHDILLDAVRADIEANKRLNYHYYMSLKKAVYKPAAFFKGIVLALCQPESYCTLREAAIIASVLQRVSIPVHHSAVALHKLATISTSPEEGTTAITTTTTELYNGATSIFIKTLLNKKYALPDPVIGVLVTYFTSFTSYHHSLPVLWHQALLCFVQRYKNEVQGEARESLRLLMKVHPHPLITPEIRRELFGAQAWKEEREGIP